MNVLLVVSCTFAFIEHVNSFSLIDFTDIANIVIRDSVGSLDALRRAALPNDLVTTISLGASEAIAGGIGALASRTTSDALGNRRTESVSTKVSSTSTFFGVQGITYCACRLFGFPSPISTAFSSVAGSYASEQLKSQGRKWRRIARGGDTTNTFDTAEFTGDLSKWVAFDGLVDANKGLITEYDKSLIYFAYGSLAACVGLFCRDLFQYINQQNSEEDTLNIFSTSYLQQNSDRYFKASLEGGVLFGSYAIIGTLLRKNTPSSLNPKFPFNQFLIEVESEMRSFSFLQ